MDFSLLINKDIIAILIGDVNVFGSYSLPRMSGPNLCNLCTQFGLKRTYEWGGANSSRWGYMYDLLEFLNKQGRVGDLLSYLMDMSRFDELNGLGDLEKVKETYRAIVESAIRMINSHLLIARKEVRIVHNKFIMASIGEDISFETPKVKVINSEYIKELPDRIKDDIANKDYDSVITKSRTLLEEVLIHIIEKMTFERYKSNGNLIKIYQDATELLNMRHKNL